MSVNMPILIVGAILLLIVALWIAWKIIDVRSRRPTEPGYVTVCVYGENGTRFRIRRRISESAKMEDYEIPDFLRR